jgi:hypothetical protein
VWGIAKFRGSDPDITEFVPEPTLGVSRDSRRHTRYRPADAEWVDKTPYLPFLPSLLPLEMPVGGAGGT